MAEEQKSATKPAAKAKKEKPPALEDKPFDEFIQQHFVPGVKEALADEGIEQCELNFTKAPIAAPGMKSDQDYWQVQGDIGKNRQFYLYFLEEDIKGKKAFAYATNGGKPSTIESFMIDERKITLDLLVLYTLQRLDGQKWLKKN